MAYPVFYPFKSRYYVGNSTSTGATINVVVAARGKYLGGQVASSSSTLTPVVDVLLNSVGITGSTGVSLTSSTSPFMGGGTAIPSPTVAIYLSPGDVLSTTFTSAVNGLSVTHVVQEF